MNVDLTFSGGRALTQHLDIHIVRELAGKNSDGLLTAQILALESAIRADLNISLQAQTNIAKADDVHGK